MLGQVKKSAPIAPLIALILIMAGCSGPADADNVAACEAVTEIQGDMLAAVASAVREGPQAAAAAVREHAPRFGSVRAAGEVESGLAELEATWLGAADAAESASGSDPTALDQALEKVYSSYDAVEELCQ
jgi:hypothetical protein